MHQTHEQYIQQIAHFAINRLPSDLAAPVKQAKIIYGRGETGLRGITCFSQWHQDEAVPLVEICAAGESDVIQLAGTTLHELGHVLGGPMAGHSKAWHLACAQLGLRHCHAAGHRYRLADFAPDVRHYIAQLPKPTDGRPNGWINGLAPAPKPCSAGIGTRGGKSRGVGSGSRMLKYTCECVPPVIIRAARAELHAHCDECQCSFKR